MRLYVPPPNAQNPASKHRFYISSGTASFAVWVMPASSPQATSLPNAQVFPFATPSPCASATGGGYTCTLTVTAPFGTDDFYVATFAVASPSANSTPISIYGPAVVDVGTTPNPNATPLSFSLNAVPASIALSVSSPDPGNTPQTQVFTAGTSGSGQLGIAVKDASGNQILSDSTAQFSPAIAIQASPSNAGISLSLTSSCGAANVSSASSVQVSCAADLANVQFSYNGSVNENASDEVIDSTTFTASSSFASPSPAPAYAVLQSTVAATQIPVGSFSVSDAWLVPNGSSLIYLLTNGSQAETGTFSPAAGTVTAPQSMSTQVYDPISTTIAGDQSYWLLDQESGVIDCWSSYANAANSSDLPTQISVPQVGPDDPLSVQGIAADGSGNIWYVGYDQSFDQEYAGYFPSGSCAQPGTFPTPYALSGDTGGDPSSNLAGLTNGIAFNSSVNGVYAVTTSGVQNDDIPKLGAGSSGDGVAVDGAQTIYGDFSSNGIADMENLSSGTMLLQLAPTSLVNYSGPQPGSVAAFSPSGGTADRLAYAENDFGLIGELSNLTSSSATGTFAAMPAVGGESLWQVIYGQNGIPYAIYWNANSGVTIAGAIDTSTWNIPETTSYACFAGIFTIDQRGDSGPFTWTFPNGGSAAAFPGTDHVFAITPPSFNTPFEAIVTDQNGAGRSETYQLTVNDSNC